MFLTGFFGGMVAGILCALIVSFVFFTPIETPYSYNEEIVCIQDNSGLSGDFFLGSGTIDQKQYYAYYVKEKNGAKYLKKIEADGVPIFEDADSIFAYLKNNCIETKYPKSNWCVASDSWDIKSREFHLPKGAIIRNIILDAK
jgi:hypothetical protein